MTTATRLDASRGVQGLLRAADSVDALLDRIRFDLLNGFLPQKEELGKVLNLGDSIRQRVEHWAYEDILDLEQWEDATVAFSGAALQLAQLEDALVDLRRAVTWSSRFSGFNWWMRSRQRELEIDSFIVIAGPGSCRDFFIERESGVAKSFSQASLLLGLEKTKLEALGHIRILTVPQNDGASSKWHPISLGHELAHLRFDQNWVLNWLSEQSDTFEAGSGPILIAKQTLEEGLKTPTTQVWFTTLCSWLMETCCDSVMYHYYGEAAVSALATYLSVHSSQEDGKDHPAPHVRTDALTATAGTMAAHRLAADQVPHIQVRKNAYCELAVPIRDAVFAEVGSDHVDPNQREAVRARAESALDNNTSPHSGDWEPNWVLTKPASIESGLVGSLWAELEKHTVPARANSDLNTLQESRVEHSVDFLQFIHRFEERRASAGTSPPAETDRPTNVLHVGANGVTSDPDASTGQTSHDVRLGRHFIVFRRNQIATLNALGTGTPTRQIQEAVEIGWGDEFVLHPGEMVLAVTLESIVMGPTCTAQVLSRSSLGRMGLLSATAVQVQPGFRGCLTLELVNLASVPLRLSPGQRVAQIVPTLALGTPEDYAGKYQNQDGKPHFSAVNNDWEIEILGNLREERTENGK